MKAGSKGGGWNELPRMGFRHFHHFSLLFSQSTEKISRRIFWIRTGNFRDGFFVQRAGKRW
ncbi:MAG: hypothetical protein ABTQ25_14180 [Nitrosomonas ureae]